MPSLPAPSRVLLALPAPSRTAALPSLTEVHRGRPLYTSPLMAAANTVTRRWIGSTVSGDNSCFSYPALNSTYGKNRERWSGVFQPRPDLIPLFACAMPVSAAPSPVSAAPLGVALISAPTYDMGLNEVFISAAQPSSQFTLSVRMPDHNQTIVPDTIHANRYMYFLFVRTNVVDFCRIVHTIPYTAQRYS